MLTSGAVEAGVEVEVVHHHQLEGREEGDYAMRHTWVEATW